MDAGCPPAQMLYDFSFSFSQWCISRIHNQIRKFFQLWCMVPVIVGEAVPVHFPPLEIPVVADGADFRTKAESIIAPNGAFSLQQGKIKVGKRRTTPNNERGPVFKNWLGIVPIVVAEIILRFLPVRKIRIPPLIRRYPRAGYRLFFCDHGAV